MEYKKTFLMTLIVTSYCFFAVGQNLPIDKKTGKVIYSEVVKVDSTITKYQLYSKAREWIANVFISSKDVIQMDDREAGKIIVKGSFELTSKLDIDLMKFTISIYLKDGKYKYVITDFIRRYYVDRRYYEEPIEVVINNSKNATTKIRRRFMKQKLDHTVEKMTDLIRDLKQTMQIKTLKNEDDW